jgi:hypothetical protein
VKRDSLSFQEIIDLFNGKTITTKINVRFFRSLNNLSIKIKPVKINITKKSDKELINNNYIPLSINNINTFNNLINKLTKKLLKFLKLFKIKH